jgi:hypothetical protein
MNKATTIKDPSRKIHCRVCHQEIPWFRFLSHIQQKHPAAYMNWFYRLSDREPIDHIPNLRKVTVSTIG